MKEIKILKLGRLNIQPERWTDALDTVNKVTVVMEPSKEFQNPPFEYFFLDLTSFVNHVIIHFIQVYNENQKYASLMRVLIRLLRFVNRGKIRRIMKSLDYNEVHVSYNDFDESALFLLLFYPYLKKGVRITRAYKESRPGYRFLEEQSFKLSNRIVLNEKENVAFFENKYGTSIFKDKEVVIELDEDALGDKFIKGIDYSPKLSEQDGQKHVVILASKVFSDSSDPRSGSRLFYIPLIRSFIESGLIVHLHTLLVVPDKNGVNQYERISQDYPGKFIIEAPLAFDGERWKEGYYTLSRYDYGILHNFIENTSNSEFDKYNIPHRYFEYQLAHVVPILLEGKTIVMERVMKEKQSGVIYKSPKELLAEHKIVFDIRSFSKYINSLYA